MPGGPVADAVFDDLAPRIKALVEAGRRPGLATVLIGDDEPSERYVGMKMRKAEELGMTSPHVRLPHDATTEQVLEAVRRLNDDPAVDGMLVQYPGPPQVDFDAVLMAMDPDKDVDGLHPTNVGRLALGIPGPVSCTPAGIEAILTHYRVPVAGREVVIVGRGVTIGRPLSILLSQKRPTANAAVTLVHTGVPDWADHARRADILVAAAGVPGMVQPEHIRPGAVVIGAGVRYEGKKLLPDVDERCEEVAGWITPRVGGVGPTTIAMLFRNCVEAAERRGVAVMSGALTELPAVAVEGHRSSGLGTDDHPMRIMTRRAAGLLPDPWDDAARAEVTAYFDAMAEDWHTRTSPARDAVVADALERGLPVDLGRSDVCLELGSGIGAYTPALAARWRRVLAVEVSFEMLLRAPADVGHRVLADGARLPLRDATAGAVVLVNCFLFPDEVARVLAPDGVVVWVNSSGGETPIHLTAEEVVQALPGRWAGVTSGAGVGLWTVLHRDGR